MSDAAEEGNLCAPRRKSEAISQGSVKIRLRKVPFVCGMNDVVMRSAATRKRFDHAQVVHQTLDPCCRHYCVSGFAIQEMIDFMHPTRNHEGGPAACLIKLLFPSSWFDVTQKLVAFLFLLPVTRLLCRRFYPVVKG